MSMNDLVRIWKDPDATDRSDHPAGEITLAYGANGVAAEDVRTEFLGTLGCCNGFTNDTCTCVPWECTITFIPICPITIM